MIFKLRNVWGEKSLMQKYYDTLLDHGFEVAKEEEETRRGEKRDVYHIKLYDIQGLRDMCTVLEHEVILYNEEGEWILEIYDGWRE